MPKAELDLIAPSSAPAVDALTNGMYQRMKAAAEAGDVPALANGITGVLHLIDRLKFVREEAAKLTHDLLPDEQYKYRGKVKTRKGPWISPELRVEPATVGGGWHKFDYLAVLKAVAEKAWGLQSLVISPEGEVVATVEEVVAELAACVSFSNVKADYEKGTGLAKWEIERSDIGEYEPPRYSVRVQRTKDGS